MRQAANPRVHETVVEALRTRIEAGEWRPGERLPSLTALAQLTGVGTGSVREAVRALQSIGMLRMEHGRGTFVQSARPANGDAQADAHTPHHLLALCEARRVIEPELAALACDRGSDTEVSEIVRVAFEMDALARRGRDVLDADVVFHRRVAQASHNPYLLRMLDTINEQFYEPRARSALQPGAIERASRYHQVIADAIQQRSPSLARQRMLAHINDTTNGIVSVQSNEQSNFIEVIS